MKLSERKRKDLRPTPAGDCVYFWLDDIEELEKLETQFEAELKAVKNDYERIKQLEAEKERLQSTIDFAHIVASRVEAERDTAELAYANECATNVCIKAENQRLREIFAHNTEILMQVAYQTYVEDGVALEDALKEGE